MIEELQSALYNNKITKTEFVRIQAVLFRKKKLSRHETAAMVGKSIHALEDWVTAYNQKGIAGLMSNYPKHSGRAKLSQRQREKVKQLLLGSPKAVGIANEEYWRLDLVKKLVYQETKVRYESDSSYHRLMAEAGLSYQKVSFEDHRKDQGRRHGFRKQFEAKIKRGHISMWW